MEPPRSFAAALLRSLRPPQWIKNVLLFGGLAFTGRWHAATSGGGAAAFLNWRDIGHACAGFVVFCALSSAGYLVNDIRDVEDDRRHPTKCRRPIAAGELPLPAAWTAAALLFFGGLAWAALLSRRGGDTVHFQTTAVAYIALTLGYSFKLKHLVLIDVLSIAVLFVLRAVAGCFIVPEPPSPWIIVCTLFGALFISLCKRRAELVANTDLADGAEGEPGQTRSVLAKYHTEQGYDEALLDQLVNMSGTATILTYAMYTFSRPAEIGMPHEQSGLMLTIPFVVYGVFRYLYLAHKRDIGQKPEQLFRDPMMLANLALWALVVVYVTKGRAL